MRPKLSTPVKVSTDMLLLPIRTPVVVVVGVVVVVFVVFVVVVVVVVVVVLLASLTSGRPWFPFPSYFYSLSSLFYHYFLYQHSPICSFFCWCSPFFSHALQVSLNTSTHRNLGLPRLTFLPHSGHLISASCFFHRPFFPHDRPIITYSS